MADNVVDIKTRTSAKREPRILEMVHQVLASTDVAEIVKVIAEWVEADPSIRLTPDNQPTDESRDRVASILRDAAGQIEFISDTQELQ